VRRKKAGRLFGLRRVGHQQGAAGQGFLVSAPARFYDEIWFLLHDFGVGKRFREQAWFVIFNSWTTSVQLYQLVLL
jgi:hypothetical protein